MSSAAKERAAALLFAALEYNNPDLPEYPDAYLRWLATALTAALATRETLQASFASRVRSLCFNLKSNHELRRQLCARERSAEETAAMSTAAWARCTPKSAGCLVPQLASLTTTWSSLSTDLAAPRGA